MTAYNVTQPPDASVEIKTSTFRFYEDTLSYPATSPQTGGRGMPIPFCTRYAPSGSVAFLYVQTDRTLVTSGAMTTASNYTIIGTSAPTVTGVSFTTGKSYVRLTLSGVLSPLYAYSLKIATGTFGDGTTSIYNIATTIPIFVDRTPTQSGIAETIDVGTPTMS